MDWVRDRSGIGDVDLKRVFDYHWQPATVAQLSHNGRLIHSELDSGEGWDTWLTENVPAPDDTAAGPGLTLVFAGRTQRTRRIQDDKELSEGSDYPVSFASDPSDTASDGLDFSPAILRTSNSSSSRGSMLNDGNEASLRVVPFGLDTFRSITGQLYTHGSIARVISRSDIPIFMASEVRLSDCDGKSHRAYVYNARSSKVWKMDLALTATYFPQSGRTHAILFGGTEELEQTICRRLQLSNEDAAHPLLIFGILAEIERAKHVLIIEETMNKLEAKIFELAALTSAQARSTRAETERRSRDRNDVWLDTAYLRNNLISWTSQLKRMIEHAEQSSFGLPSQKSSDVPHENIPLHDRQHCLAPVETDATAPMASTNKRIINRLNAIVDEYHDKIRDCSMLLDGMAMATQWSFSDTNVEIALSTSRDSRYMRSIALITMIFLPGTFLASVFSMTFFDWFGPEGTATVSESIWIYCVIAGSCTAITLGLWYYWTNRRPR